MKLAVVFSADRRDLNGKPIRDVSSVSYNVVIEISATVDLDEFLSEFVRSVELRG